MLQIKKVEVKIIEVSYVLMMSLNMMIVVLTSQAPLFSYLSNILVLLTLEKNMLYV